VPPPLFTFTAAASERVAKTVGLILHADLQRRRHHLRPGSAKGIMFITLEDETGIANLVVWPTIFEKHRRIILSAGMFAVKGRIKTTRQPTRSDRNQPIETPQLGSGLR
jgi:DNA polymerase III alpha subunit